MLKEAPPGPPSPTHPPEPLPLPQPPPHLVQTERSQEFGLEKPGLGSLDRNAGYEARVGGKTLSVGCRRRGQGRPQAQHPCSTPPFCPSCWTGPPAPGTWPGVDAHLEKAEAATTELPRAGSTKSRAVQGGAWASAKFLVPSAFLLSPPFPASSASPLQPLPHLPLC